MISKIKTKDDVARDARRKQLIIGIVMVGLLVVSTAGYALLTASSDDSGIIEEGGIEFVVGNGGYIARIDGFDYGFRYLPSEVSDVPVTGSFDLSEFNSNRVLYYTENNEAVPEIINNIGRFVLRYQEACLNGSASCTQESVRKTCSDYVLVFDDSNSPGVVRQGNCVRLLGDPVKSADAFLYKLLKVN